MIKRKRAMMLLEVSVLLCCVFILWLSAGRGVSSQNLVLERMIENNDVLMLMESMASKIELDLSLSGDLAGLKLEEYQSMLGNSPYKVVINSSNNRVYILLGVKDEAKGLEEMKRVYEREVLLNEK